MSSLAFIETNLSVNHQSPMTVIFMSARKKITYIYIYTLVILLSIPALKIHFRAANAVDCDMWRRKGSLDFLLWRNILERILTKEDLTADVYAEGEWEKEKGRESRRERERKD